MVFFSPHAFPEIKLKSQINFKWHRLLWKHCFYLITRMSIWSEQSAETLWFFTSFPFYLYHNASVLVYIRSLSSKVQRSCFQCFPDRSRHWNSISCDEGGGKIVCHPMSLLFSFTLHRASQRLTPRHTFQKGVKSLYCMVEAFYRA